MATFPSFTPSSRTFTPGTRPSTAVTTLSGEEDCTSNSNCIVGQSLRLGFKAFTQANALLIVSHYNGERGGFQRFAIPDSVLSGISDPAAITPAGYGWIYSSPPNVIVTPGAPLFRDITLELGMERI